MNNQIVARSFPSAPVYADGRFEDIKFPVSEIENTDSNVPVSPLRFGFGACTKCGCQHFEGNASTCGNRGCGHAYEDHW